jgi:hypothetical protein
MEIPFCIVYEWQLIKLRSACDLALRIHAPRCLGYFSSEEFKCMCETCIRRICRPHYSSARIFHFFSLSPVCVCPGLNAKKRARGAKNYSLLCPLESAFFLAALFAELTHFFQINAEGRGRRTRREKLSGVFITTFKRWRVPLVLTFSCGRCGAELKTLRLLNK